MKKRLFNLSLLLLVMLTAVGVRAQDSLAHFNLLTPSNGTAVTLPRAGSVPINISWNGTVATTNVPATYTFLLDTLGGNFSTPWLSQNQGADTSLTLTSDQVLTLLAGRGIQPGQAVQLIWTVRAQADTLSTLAHMPFDLALTFGTDTLSVYSLAAPPAAINLVYHPGQASAAVASWDPAIPQASGSNVQYEFLLDTVGSSFANPLIVANADGSGSQTQFSLTEAVLASVVNAFNIGAGTSKALWWTVRAKSGILTMLADQPRPITIWNNPDTLASFSLTAPANNAVVDVPQNAPSSYTITWNASLNSAPGNAPTYTWLLDTVGGTFSTPLASISANNNGLDAALTLTGAAINNLLASLNVPAGSGATVQWTVVAKNTADSISADVPFTITLNRSIDTLSNFALVGPADGAVVNVPQNAPASYNISWNSSVNSAGGVPVTYTWLLDTVGGTFATPLASIASNNAGQDTVLTLSSAAVNGLLASLNVAAGSGATVQWTVRAVYGTDTTLADAPFTITLNRSIDTLSNFALVGPADGAVVNVPQNAPASYNISWNSSVNSAGGVPVTYTWLLDTVGGTFATPLASIASNNAGQDTVLTLSSAAVNGLLASLNVAAGSGATVQWTVRAVYGTDTTLADAPFTITLNRSIDTLSNFALVGPADGAVVNVPQNAPASYNISWNSSVNSAGGVPVTYTWLLDTVGGTFATPLASIASNNAGQDTVLTLSSAAVNGLLASLNVAAGSGATVQWTVRAVYGTDTTLADAPFTITLNRSIDTLSNFALVGPADGAVVNVPQNAPASYNISWNSSVNSAGGVPVTYTWLLDTVGGTFATPLASIVANNNGLDTVLTLNHTAVNNLLASLNVGVGSGATVSWTVMAKYGNDSLLASAPFTITLNRVADSLSAFALVGPADGAVVNVPQNATANYTITWNPSLNSAGGVPVTYTWLLDTVGGNFSAPLAAIASNNSGVDTALTLSNTAINALLASLNVPAGSGATVSWTVQAKFGADSIKATAPFTITLNRVIDTLSAFALIAPANNTVVTLPTNATGNYTISWQSSVPNEGGPVTYTWYADTTANSNFSNAVVFLPSANNGLDTTLTLSATTINTLLSNLGVTVGQSATLYWNVKATNGVTLNRWADSTFSLTFNRVIDSLASFALLTPPNGATVNVPQSGTVNYDITWNASQRTQPGSITYTWMLDSLGGNFSQPLATLPSNNSGVDTMLTLSNGVINNLLASLGVGVGQSATVKWTVMATSGNLTLPASAPFNITLFRQPDTLSAFSLLTPADNTVLPLLASATAGNVNITWNRSTSTSGNNVNYTWLLDLATGNFSSPLATIVSNNSGADTALTLTLGQINTLLNSLSVAVGSTTNLKWTIRATSGNDNRLATAFNLTIIRLADSLSAFNLIGPANNTALSLTGSPSTSLNINWGRSTASNGSPVTYTWLVDLPGNNFSNPIVSLPSNNSGADTAITLTYGAVANLLAANGVPVNVPTDIIWTVRATAGTINRLAAQPYTLVVTWNFLTSAQNLKLGEVRMFPNPANAMTSLEMKYEQAADMSLAILDMQGRVLKQNELKGFAEGRVDLDLTDLPAGMYLVRVARPEGIQTMKLKVTR